MRFLLTVIGVIILHLYPGLGYLPDSTRVVHGDELSRETIRNMNTYEDFGAYLRSICAKYGDKTFRINAETEESVTWNDILYKSHGIAKLLLNKGCSTGSVIGVYCENSFEYPSILLATLNIGATYTSVDIRLNEDDIIHNFNLSRPSIVFTSTKFYRKIRHVQQRVNSIRSIVNVDEAIYPSHDYENFQYVEKNSEDTAMISYTSGSTGLPKGVKQSHKTWIYQMELYKTEKVIPEFPQDNISAALLPPGRTFELYTILTSFVLGHQFIMIEEYRNALNYIDQYKINTFYTNPSSASHLAVDPEYKHYLSSVKLILVGGDFLQPEMEEKLKDLYECTLYYLYGQTETAGFSMVSSSSKTNGHLMPGMSGKIISVNTGEPLGPLKRGEICLRGPLVFTGYLGSVSTSQALDNEGWLHSGDYGYYDRDANFYIMDRLKNVIEGGGQVREIENILLGHPNVKEAVVVPVPSRWNGLRAYVVIDPENSVDAASIQQYVNSELPSHSGSQSGLSEGVIIVKSLPKVNDKVARREVQKWAN